MNVFGQLISAVLEKISSDPSSPVKGQIWYNTTSDLFKFRGASTNKTIVDTDTTQALSNKEFDVQTLSQQSTPSTPASGKVKTYIKNDKRVYVLNESGTEKIVGSEQAVVSLDNQGSTPSTPSAGVVKIYTKTDKNAYMLDDSGAERLLGSGGSGSNLVWEKLGDTSTTTLFQDGLRLEEFANTDTQELYTTITLPSTYLTGTPIVLKAGSFFCPVNSGNVLFKCDVALLRSGSTVLGTYTNSYTSTNTQVAVPGTINQLKDIGDIDLTSSTGTINAIAVQAGDKLRIRLYRAISSETSGAVDVARLLVNAFELKITR